MSNPCHSQGIHRIWLCSFQRSRAGRPRRNIWPQVSKHPWRTSTPAKSTSLHTNAASHRGDVWSYTWGILGVKLESGTFKFRIASLMCRGYDLCYCVCVLLSDFFNKNSTSFKIARGLVSFSSASAPGLLNLKLQGWPWPRSHARQRFPATQNVVPILSWNIWTLT